MAAETFGLISLVPPLLAIVLAIVTRKPILSLFLGIWSGAVIFTGGHGFVQTLEWVAGSIGDESLFNPKIMMIVLFLGAGVALIWRLGGAAAIANAATSRLDTQRKVGLGTWIFGMLWFFGDYSNTAIVGTTMREIADEMRISREKLSYIIDSTAAPVATFGISSWVVYQLSMIREGYDAAGIEAGADAPAAFALFLQSVPFNMYCIFAVVMVGIIVITQRDFGEMLDAEHRSWKEGKVLRDNAVPMQSAEDSLGEMLTDSPQLRYFLVPVGSLIVVVFSGAIYTGLQGAESGASVLDIVGGADFVSALLWGTFTMVSVGIIMGVVGGLADLDEAMETVIDGFSMMLTALSILVMAWTIGTVTTELGTGVYVTNVAEQFVTPMLLPIVVLLASALIAFSTGTSWGTMAIVTPIAVPLAWSVGSGTPELLPAAIGTVFSGAIFGDHCSPISDTTILSSTFTGADHIDHVRTQMYYAVTVLSVAMVMLLVWGATNVTPLVLLPVGVGLLYGLVYALSEWDANRKGVVPQAGRAPQEVSASDD
ncbi:Na+/H+ antiporter NhaC family protein [Halorussus salilacus]|uniref:Na+/H+ antiporter NhaC family protein n=1 Tax=Halorussus salilacus TaxID=2953750 RepID=UPI00209F0E0E|nr:Na+/H+ antiporter NhaC family protein [Halorussus salilacus]USZ67446.1 Na+/H+ antiporter NhaC family protein [Halorussus salilacus]